MKNPLLGFFLTANLIFFIFGYLTADESTATVASLESPSKTPEIPDLTNVASFHSIPCPSAIEASEIKRKFNLTLDLKNWSCSSEDIRTYVLKGFSLVSKFNFFGPETWDANIRMKYSDNGKYLTLFAKEINIDHLSASTTLAYYSPNNRTISLTERLKHYSPIDFISTLIHENRHAEKPDIGHVECIAGDLPRFSGACDETFSTHENAMGAYNSTIYFSAGSALYAKDLLNSEREYLKSSALTTLANRFNWVPKEVGHFQDLVVILDESSSIKWLHPFINKTFLISEFPTADRIESALDGSGSLTIFQTNGGFKLWNLAEGFKDYMPEIFKGKNILDLARSRIPFHNSDVLMTFIDGGTPGFIGFDSTTKKKASFPFQLFREKDLIPNNLKRIVFGYLDESFFIDQQGKLLRAAHFGSDPGFDEDPTLQKEKGWNSGSGGVLHDSLYLIDNTKNLFQLRIENKKTDYFPIDEGPSESEKLILEQKKFESTDQIQKYSQGTGFEAILDDQGRIFVKKYALDSTLNNELPIPLTLKIKDFALVRNLYLNKNSIAIQKQASKEFLSQCHIKKSMVEPWTFKGIGIDRSGKFIFEGDKLDRCLYLPTKETIIDFSIVDEMSINERKTWDKNERHQMFYSRPAIKLILKNEFKTLRPYEYE